MTRTNISRSALALLLLGSTALTADDSARTDASADEAEPLFELPPLERPGEPYRTPRSGEGFRTTVFGEDVEVQPRNRRHVTAWDLGFMATIPGADETEFLPYGSLYLWRHPDDDTLFRGVVAVLYNELFYAKSPPDSPLEAVFTFENYNVPMDQSELVDGKKLDEEEVTYGYVRPGIGGGWRTPTAPGEQDNMAAFSLIFMPGFQYFREGHDAADDFITPQDGLDLRIHGHGRWDALSRNLLDLPHEGFVFGGDAYYGYRTNWEDWGRSGAYDAGTTRDYNMVTAYALHAGGVPFVESERHRFVGSVYGGIGNDVDRFSAQKVGGGPTGEEYNSIWRPVLPRAAIQEFFPEHYAMAIAEYRWELIFFSYLSLRSSVAWLDRDRRRSSGLKRQDDVLPSVGARITTGFLLSTRLQIDYNYNFGVIRQGEYGGHEVVFHLSSDF